MFASWRMTHRDLSGGHMFRTKASALALGLAAAFATPTLGSAGERTTAAELPTFQLMGLPISPVQAQVVTSAHIEEMPPAPTLMLGGMPASPHQIAVLRPRPPTTEAASASK